MRNDCRSIICFFFTFAFFDYANILYTNTDAGTIETTVYHPFWVTNGRDLDERSAPRELEPNEDEGLSLFGRWVNSHELRAGDKLVGQDGRLRTVLRVEQRYEPSFAVCNLTIGENHTFAVGPDALLVHNTAKCGGETPATIRGRQAHTDYNPGPGFEKEVRLPSGRRADAVNVTDRVVKELKPDNPRAIARGKRQVERYRQELEDLFGGDFTGIVDTYNP